MRYIKFTYGIGYVGCQEELYVSFSAALDEFLDSYASDLADNYSESYRDYERFGLLDSRDEYESEEAYQEAYAQAEEDWYSGVWSSWEEVTLEEFNENNGECGD